MKKKQLTQIEKIIKLLKRKKWVSVQELYQASYSTCISTKISEIRRDYFAVENIWKEIKGKRVS
jgi:hypothetical protein